MDLTTGATCDEVARLDSENAHCETDGICFEIEPGNEVGAIYASTGGSDEVIGHEAGCVWNSTGGAVRPPGSVNGRRGAVLETDVVNGSIVRGAPVTCVVDCG